MEISQSRLEHISRRRGRPNSLLRHDHATFGENPLTVSMSDDRVCCDCGWNGKEGNMVRWCRRRFVERN